MLHPQAEPDYKPPFFFLPVSSKVSTSRTEGLGEGPHHDVYICGVHPQVLADAPPICTHGANAVRLI